MRKKIFKYLKFTLCVGLIFSFILPSFAANAASDGSAFVTKEEFDKALADFNARLTTFEAGINSKIDSQVTSYLDRNGIWNGLEQEYDTGDPARNYYVFNVCGDLIPISGYQGDRVWYRRGFNTDKGEWVYHTLAYSYVDENATYYWDNPASIAAGGSSVATAKDAHYFTVREAGNSYYRPFINNVSKSGLLMGYYGYRSLWIHSQRATTGDIMYNFPNNSWLKIFNAKPASERNFSALLNTLPTTTSLGNETIILGQTANAPSNYTPGGIFIDMEVWDDDETHLYYRNNLYKWDMPVPAAQGLDPEKGHTDKGWTTVCQWTGGSYDPSGHAAWLNFFVSKGDKLKLKFNIYCRGRTWDGNVHFCAGVGYPADRDTGLISMRSWLAMIPDDLQVY